MTCAACGAELTITLPASRHGGEMLIECVACRVKIRIREEGLTPQQILERVWNDPEYEEMCRRILGPTILYDTPDPK